MNFTNYYTFNTTRKPNNRLANQPTFLYYIHIRAHAGIYSLEKGRLVGEVGGMGRIRPIGQMGQIGERGGYPPDIHLTST